MKSSSVKQDSDSNHKLYSKFLTNKRVIIVGPAYHTKNTKQVDFIDSYDIVVRMNIGCKVSSEKVKSDIGDKINIWYCSFSNYFFTHNIASSKSLSVLKQKGLKWMSFLYSGRRAGGLASLNKINNKHKIPIHFVNSKYYNYLYNRTMKKISSGLMTIYDLLQFPISELHIIGMSFYNTAHLGKKRTYYSGYQEGISYVNPNKNIHNHKEEMNIFCNLYNNDKRVSCDGVLKDIISKHMDRN